MLALSRRTGQSVKIGENVYVTVYEMKGGRVKLAFDAPKSVAIVRTELLPPEGRARKGSEDSSSEASFEPVMPPRV